MPPTSRIAIDPQVISYSETKSLSTALSTPPLKSSFVAVTENLVDLMWSDRPPRPNKDIFRLDDKYTGESVADKLSHMREKLVKSGSPGMVVSQLDEVAWLFNLRGSDIDYNPVSMFSIHTTYYWVVGTCAHTPQVFFAYAIITPDESTLFTHISSLDNSVREYLHSNGIAILDYEQVWTSLESLKQNIRQQNDERESKRARTGEDVSMDGGDQGNSGKEVEVDVGKGKEKIMKTDKVLIGTKISWAVAMAVGEVRRFFE